MRLQDRFKKVFLLPLIFGVVTSIVLTISMLFLFSQKFSTNQDYIKQIKEIELEKTQPFIETSRLMLFRKFQRSLTTLNLISDYYDFYAKELKGLINSTLVNSYSYNSLYLNDNLDKTFDFMERDSNTSFLGITLIIKFQITLTGPLTT